MVLKCGNEETYDQLKIRNLADGNNYIEYTNNLTYLGVNINNKNCGNLEIKERLS